ncbi:hypothetical protein [Vibrio agarivorans]|uniref:Uncharacterized protein n=1 Tax=Vibrio agarivorans TaxID=153622 RepID=A0ABT7Y790_9VIBR|nr:hypothetical protein [Vibrio agarivorans]MDN2483908.1 hypothetical protein [Vibrio agarivorans]
MTEYYFDFSSRPSDNQHQVEQEFDSSLFCKMLIELSNQAPERVKKVAKNLDYSVLCKINEELKTVISQKQNAEIEAIVKSLKAIKASPEDLKRHIRGS